MKLNLNYNKSNTMAKPILLIKSAFSLNEEMHLSIKKMVEDYHIFFVVEKGIESIKFETYNAKDATDIDIEELKKIITNVS